MKYLPHVTVILWLLYSAFCVFFPRIALGIYSLFPALAIITILAAVCFWNLQFRKKRLTSILYIGIFLINTAVTGNYLLITAQTFTQIEPYRDLVIKPDLAQRIYSGEDEVSRENTSRYIFENTGLITAYKKDDGTLQKYTPTKLEFSTLQMNINTHLALLNDKIIARSRLFDLFLLFSTQVLIFSFILIYLILSEGPGREQKLKAE